MAGQPHRHIPGCPPLAKRGGSGEAPCQPCSVPSTLAHSSGAGVTPQTPSLVASVGGRCSGPSPLFAFTSSSSKRRSAAAVLRCRGPLREGAFGTAQKGSGMFHSQVGGLASRSSYLEPCWFKKQRGEQLRRANFAPESPLL